MPRAARKWTQEEDDLLSREANLQVAGGKLRDWTVIANKISGRTNKDCRKRWHNALSGVFNKGYWTEEEDKLLTRAVQTHGEIWTAAAEIVTMRSADQCAKRWKQFLDPQLNHSEWTEEEDSLLVEVAAVKGRKWKEIQMEHFPSRSRNSIKNQYTILTRRESRLRNGRIKKAGDNQGKSAARRTGCPTDSRQNNDGEKMNIDEESSDEEDEISGEEGVSGDVEEGIKTSTSTTTSNYNSVLETPDNGYIYAEPDTLAWGNFKFLAGVPEPGPAWDPAAGNVDLTGDADLNGTLPDLPAVSSDYLQGIDYTASETADHALCSNFLNLIPTDMTEFSRPDEMEMVGLEPHHPANLPLQGTIMTHRSCQSNKIVLSFEEADDTTVNSLLQIAISSGSRFNFARE